MEGTDTAKTPGLTIDDSPFYSRASFWLGPFVWMLGVVIATALAIAWYSLGGFPRDHDRYGEVPVPGTSVLELPEGDVRINFENHATQSGDSTTIDDQPYRVIGILPSRFNFPESSVDAWRPIDVDNAGARTRVQMVVMRRADVAKAVIDDRLKTLTASLRESGTLPNGQSLVTDEPIQVRLGSEPGRYVEYNAVLLARY